MTERPRSFPSLTASLLAGRDLTAEEAAWAMEEVMDGAAPSIALAGFLVALSAKGVVPRELAAFADAMIGHARRLPVDRHAVDIVGTGGDMAQTVNISTMASLVIAATGRRVVKHGNRASSSKSGSADVLEALGVRLDLEVDAVARMVEQVGITFAFAQVFHPSMRFAAEARKGLGVPTVFNVLGPITNPGRPRAGAVGVAAAPLAPIVAEVFASRGTSALVFRGQDGLDELSVAAASDVWEVRGGTVSHTVLDPETDLGLQRSPLEALRGGTAEENAQVVRDLLAGRTGAVRDAVLLNAAAGIVAHDGIASQEAAEGGLPSSAEVPSLVERLRGAVAEGAAAIDSGAGDRLLTRWIEASSQA
ncbi:anthranilate phosphoribosyltransferase [Brachybacterium sp. EF45031]|uniref:anthranilate phosphoribosyltransferase n=1 Tax=Brachybacterium sillae TaxID=2810536 RepID=UPI00217E2DC8|nr:anthranilate phosphoribosyltransferase [Brachybacterium sillae]MCS6710485.1 anthranilate phosphoribosyltransferase [Brachybacterium sillae]